MEATTGSRKHSVFPEPVPVVTTVSLPLTTGLLEHVSLMLVECEVGREESLRNEVGDVGDLGGLPASSQKTLCCLCERLVRRPIRWNRFDQGIAVDASVLIKELSPLRGEVTVADIEWELCRKVTNT